LAPSRLDRDFTATMSPSDTAIRPRQRLWLPVRGCPLRTPNRVSQVPAGSFRARCLLSPRGVRSVRVVVASRLMLASPNPVGWPLPCKCNEAEPSSRDATARAFASPSLGAQGRPHTLWVRLHDSRPIAMINSFQLTRTSQALLGAFRMDTDKHRWGARPPRAQPTAPSRLVLGSVTCYRTVVVSSGNASSARARKTAAEAPAVPISIGLPVQRTLGSGSEQSARTLRLKNLCPSVFIRG